MSDRVFRNRADFPPAIVDDDPQSRVEEGEVVDVPSAARNNAT